MKRTTYQAYECHVGVHFTRTFGPLALQAIHRDTIQGYLASKLAAGTKPKSVKNHFVILKEMLKYAVGWHCLVTNPAAGVNAPGVEREEMDRRPRCATS